MIETPLYNDDPLMDYAPEATPRSTWLGILILLGALAAALVVLFTAKAALAQTVTGMCGFAKVQTPATGIIAAGNASQSLAVSTTAVSPTVPVLTRGVVVGAYAQVLVGLIQERHDGTAPTGQTDTAGAVWGPAGTSIGSTPPIYTICGSDLGKIQFIQYSQSATSARVNLYYYTIGQ